MAIQRDLSATPEAATHNGIEVLENMPGFCLAPPLVRNMAISKVLVIVSWR
jgi:hypothetical protein